MQMACQMQAILHEAFCSTKGLLMNPLFGTSPQFSFIKVGVCAAVAAQTQT